MTLPTAYEHTALLYDDADAVAAALAREIEADLLAGGAVLLCVGRELRERIAPRLPSGASGADRLQTLTAEARYSRPVDALDTLWSFTQTSMHRGARYVHSIGEIDFTGETKDLDWHWYERATNDVCAALPLRGTCLYGAHQPYRACATATRTHPLCRHDDDVRPSQAFVRDEFVAVPDGPTLPGRAADVALRGAAPASVARHELVDATRNVAPSIVERATLVLSELVTNANLHGGGVASVRVWIGADRIDMEVTDNGPGISDPYATMRPGVRGHIGGVGLWVAHLQSAQLALRPNHPRGTRAVASIC